mmetsp:Transcript_15472/g.29786  ORF Transcript_15472/g.29786 Transcript_15472/m.29786 type:complete len:574 (+) Transcript_15472:307-2028(+)
MVAPFSEYCNDLLAPSPFPAFGRSRNADSKSRCFLDASLLRALLKLQIFGVVARVPEYSHAIESDDQHGAHVGKNGQPQVGVSNQREDNHHQLACDGENEVLENLVLAVAAELDGAAQFAQVVVHEGNVRSLHGHHCACGAHGEAEVGLRKGGRVVHAVPHHGHHLLPALLLLLHQLHLVLGEELRVHRHDVGLELHALRCVRVVPRQHHCLDAHAVEQGHRLRRLLAHRVRRAEHRHAHAVHPHPAHRASRGGPGWGHGGVVGGPAQALRHAAVAHHHRACPDGSRHALPRQSLKLLHWRVVRSHALARRRLADGGGHGVRGLALNAEKELHHRRARPPGQRHQLRQRELARGQRARLVHAERAHGGERLEEDAPFDQQAVGGGEGEPAHVRHRGGDDHGAGARHHQQHERHLEVLQPGARPPQPGQRRQQRRPKHHRGGVVPRNRLHQHLRGRARVLGLLHELHEPRHGGVLRQHQRLHGEDAAAAVHRARAHRVARGLLDGAGLPRECALVHGAGAGHHHSVHGYAVARPDQQLGAHRHLLHGHLRQRVRQHRHLRAEGDDGGEGGARAF